MSKWLNQIIVTDGNEQKPSYVFENNTSSGMWNDGTNLNFSVNGTKQLEINSTGDLTVSTGNDIINGAINIIFIIELI